MSSTPIFATRDSVFEEVYAGCKRATRRGVPPFGRCTFKGAAFTPCQDCSNVHTPSGGMSAFQGQTPDEDHVFLRFLRAGFELIPAELAAYAQKISWSVPVITLRDVRRGQVSNGSLVQAQARVLDRAQGRRFRTGAFSTNMLHKAIREDDSCIMAASWLCDLLEVGTLVRAWRTVVVGPQWPMVPLSDVTAMELQWPAVIDLCLTDADARATLFGMINLLGSLLTQPRDAPTQTAGGVYPAKDLVDFISHTWPGCFEPVDPKRASKKRAKKNLSPAGG